MKSKEALESLVEIYDINKTTKQYKIIKKDLERLEQLEKEKQELNTEAINEYTNTIGHNGFQISMLQEENEKLKKAIDVLDSVLDLELENSEVWGKLTYFINSNGGSSLTKETYDFLKEFINEVLE